MSPPDAASRHNRTVLVHVSVCEGSAALKKRLKYVMAMPSDGCVQRRSCCSPTLHLGAARCVCRGGEGG